MIEYASERLKNDFDVVIEAVKNDGTSIRFISDDLKENDYILETALNARVFF